MGAGLLNLVIKGASDIYFTGNPQITFFKNVYKRYTDFSTALIKQKNHCISQLHPTEKRHTTIRIYKNDKNNNGDLLSKMYIKFNQNKDGILWDKLIDNVYIEISGSIIEKHTVEWMQIWNELTTPNTKIEGYKYLTGNINNDLYTHNETNQQSIMIPLNFWFCRDPGLSIPLCALTHHEVKLNIIWNATDGKTINGGNYETQPTFEVLCENIYLDTYIKRRFETNSHEYLITQIQYQQHPISSNKYKLDFERNITELIWTNNSEDITTQKAKLTVKDTDIFEEQNKEYFQLVQPFNYHTSIPGYNIKEFEKPQYISPIDTKITTHNTSIIHNSAKLEPHQITFDYSNCEKVPVRIGDILLITIGGNNRHSYTIQLKTVQNQNNKNVICTFKNKISEILFNIPLFNGDGLNIQIIARTQNPQSRCSQLEKEINVYSFALKPEDIGKPSGVCKCSAIDEFYLNFSEKIGNKEPLNIYAVNYNILRIVSGMGGLAYSN